MKQIDLLKAATSLLQMMKKNGMNVKDVEAISLFHDAENLLSQGLQKSYVVQRLADDYHISVRSVYSLLKRLNSEVN